MFTFFKSKNFIYSFLATMIIVTTITYLYLVQINRNNEYHQNNACSQCVFQIYDGGNL